MKYILLSFIFILMLTLYLHGANREPMPDPIKGFKDKPSVRLTW